MKLFFVITPRNLGIPWWGGSLVALWLAVVGASAWLGHVSGQYPVLCLFKRVFGVPCPSCGTTRAVLALINGQLWMAVRMNPLMTLILICLSATAVARILFRRGVRLELTMRERCVLYTTSTLAVTGNWAYVVFTSR